MVEVIMVFLMANWQSVAIALFFVVGSIVLWVKGYKKNVALYILMLVNTAKNKFEDGEGKKKFDFVLGEVYKKFPQIIRFFYTEEDVRRIIEGAYVYMKTWLENESKS